MSKMIIGIIQDRDMAEHAIEELESVGFGTEDISIIMKNKAEAHHLADSTGANVVEGAASGATTGGLIGGMAGLLIGLGAITLPGVGALLIGGPLSAALGLSGAAATTVSGAVTGALAGGLVGALVGLGVPEEDAIYYEDRVKQGAILLAIPVTTETISEAKEILKEHGVDQIRAIDSVKRTLRHDPSYMHFAGAKGGEVVEED